MQQNNFTLPSGSNLISYFRDSGGPEQELSIGQQLREYNRACEANGWHSVRTFEDEARSGKFSNKRNDFLEMIALLTTDPKPNIQGVAVWASSRMSRNPTEAPYYRSLLRFLGYTIIYISGDIYDAGEYTPIVEAVADISNAKYLEQLRKDIRRGIFDVMEKGAWCGEAPSGFKREKFQIGMKRNGKPRIVSRIVPSDQLPNVLMAFELRGQRKTIPEIHEATQLHHRSGRQLAISSYSDMFANPIYIGKRRIRGEWVDYIPPVVPPELWQRVQEVNADIREQVGANHRRASSSNDFCLNGLVKCGLCGAQVYVHTMRYQKKSGRKYAYRFYYCSRWSRNHGRNHNRLNADDFERDAIAKITADILTAESVAGMQTHLADLCDKQTTAHQAKLERLTRERSDAEREQANIQASLKFAPLSQALATQLLEVEQRANAARGKIDELNKQHRLPAVDAYRMSIERIRAAFARGEPRDIRRALQEVVDHIDATAAPQSVVVHYREL